MSSPKRFAPADILIAVLIAFVAAFLLIATNYAPAAQISVTVEGKPYGRWVLPASPETLSIAGQMRVIIDKSGARVYDASCPRGLCRHQGTLTAAGESIVCVPNRICIRLEGGERIDAQTR